MTSDAPTRDQSQSTTPVLQLEGLAKAFGGLQAVQDLSIAVYPDEILGLIGPNGAGKTTIFNLIAGTYRPDAGSVTFRGRDVTGWPPHQMVNAGIARTFQTPQPFTHKSIAANVELALMPKAIFARDADAAGRQARVRACCARVGLCATLGHDPENEADADGRCGCWQAHPGVLPQAGLRQLEIARALATDAQVLLLDEPFAGLSAAEVERLSALLLELRAEGRALVVVDHNMQGLMRLIDRAVVVHFGQVLAEGAPEAVAADPRVQEVYLAGSDDPTTLVSDRDDGEGNDAGGDGA